MDPVDPDSKSLLPIVAVVLLVLWGLMGFYQVDEKEQAVVLRLGKYHTTLWALACSGIPN